MLVVVTGAQGFLGRHLVPRLAAEGHQVVAVDRVPAPIVIQGVVNHIADLADPTALIPSDRKLGQPFILIHLAWNIKQRDAGYHVQAEQIALFAGLLDYWRERGLAYLIAPGSAQEFGARSGVLDEDALPEDPVSPYGWAKRAAYAMACSWSLQNDIGLSWLRPFIIYGEGQRGDLLVPYAVHQASTGQRAEFTDGKQIRDFVHVSDVVEAFVLAVAKRPKGQVALNLGSGDSASAREVLQSVADYFNAEDRFVFGARPRRQTDPEMQVADCSRAEQVLGWTPKMGWREGIQRVCEAVKK